MDLQTFKRGIHPPDSKALTNKKQIEPLLPEVGELLAFPVSQHIGAPCEPIVKKGDRVLVGQKIAESGGLSSPISSSVSGTVKDIKKVMTLAGNMCNAVIIENDGQFEPDSEYGRKVDYTKLSREEIIDKIKRGGIVGLGGAGFPTHVKVNPPADQKIDSILVNAAECEPYLTSDHRLMLERGEQLVKGLEILLMLHKDAAGYIGIEDNKPDAIENLEKLTKDNPKIKVVALKKKYPQGSEKHLIYAVTKREVPSGALPAAVGCIVDNVATVIGVYEAVAESKPLTKRVFTLTGEAVKNPGNYEICIGTNIKSFVERTGGFKEEPAKLIAGGPMMGGALFTIDVPVIKKSAALLCLTQAQTELPPERNCIRCGKCIEACPMGLMPASLNSDAMFNDLESFEKNHGLDCIMCGSCSYACPAKRHLAQSIIYTKGAVMAAKRKK